MDEMKYMTDYHELFNVKMYLDANYAMDKDGHPVERTAEFTLSQIHKFWATIKPSPLKSTGLTLLEFGGGASIGNLVSAAPKVARIVFAEYTEVNRNALISWIKDEPKAYDWSPCTEFIVKKLEGNSDPQSAPLRFQEVRDKIKSVVPCDITKEPVVDLDPVDLDKQFDVVSTTFCLNVCTSSVKEFKNAVAKLCKLVKPGGILLVSDLLNGSFYIVAGQHIFYNFPITEKVAKEAMEDAGLVDISFAKIALEEGDPRFDATDVFSMYGTKPE